VLLEVGAGLVREAVHAIERRDWMRWCGTGPRS
jgi:hypothetical protein